MRSSRDFALAGGLVVLLMSTLAGQPIEVIFTEIPGDPSAQVPGAVDSSGQPVFTEFLSMLQVNFSPDGAQWILQGSTTQSTEERNVLLLGAGTSGAVFAQEGQPVHGGEPGEVYDFFDGVAGFDSAGAFAYGARARDGDPAVKEKIILFDGIDYTVVIHESLPALGLSDLPPDPSGDELFGNSLNSIHLLDDGRVGFVAVTIQNIHSSRRPAIFYDDLAFAQSGVTPVDGEVWDSFDSNDFRTTPDGSRWIARGDTENPNNDVDDILAVDGSIALQEGSPVPGCGLTVADIFAFTLLPDGRWLARGDDPAENGWVTENGSCLVSAGDEIVPGSPDHWYRFTHALGNLSGDTVLGGDIDDPTLSLGVLVLNGTQEIAREGDPVDLDGNGAFDDDVFLNGFKADQAFLTEDRQLYFLATLRNGVGDSLGDAFLRIALGAGEPEFVRGDCNGDDAFDISDAITSLDYLFGGAPPAFCYDACDANDDGDHNIADPIYTLETLFNMGPFPPVPHPDCGVDPSSDGNGCEVPSCP